MSPSRATPQARKAAERLITHVLGGKHSSDTELPAAFDICEQLRPHLSMLMGRTGFRALLTRALVLAVAEVPGLRAVQVKTDGGLEGIVIPGARAGAPEMAEGSVVLIAHLIGLLFAFVGEDLTLRMLQELWPKLPLAGSDLHTGDTQ